MNMNKNYQEISFFEFQQRFQTEEDCEKRLFELRWPEGFICPRYGEKEYYDLPKRQLFQCVNSNESSFSAREGSHLLRLKNQARHRHVHLFEVTENHSPGCLWIEGKEGSCPRHLVFRCK